MVERTGKEKKDNSLNQIINQDLLTGAGIAFSILLILFTLYLTVFRKIMPDHKEDDGKPYFPFDEK